MYYDSYKRRNTIKIVLFIIFTLVVLALIAFAVYGFIQVHHYSEMDYEMQLSAYGFYNEKHNMLSYEDYHACNLWIIFSSLAVVVSIAGEILNFVFTLCDLD